MRENAARRRDTVSVVGVVLAAAALGVVLWVALSEFRAVVHGHPAYAIMLVITVVGALGFGTVALIRPVRRGAWRVTGRIALIVLAAGWIAATAWFRPYSAVEPALAAMESDDAVAVTETATRIVFEPVEADETGVFFLPGARVDPRAYAAVLRPLAEAGHTVVITKPALGIAFFAAGDFDAVAAEHSEIASWAVGGHSLGGPVAAMAASEASLHAPYPVASGLFLYASYPAGDISDYDGQALSISGSADGLATPAKIDASAPNLPDSTTFLEIPGAAHAQFGDYGPQDGDGEPSISNAEARTQIADATLAFVDGLN